MTAPAESLPPGAKFPLGRVIITANAAEWLPAEVIARALERHQSGDWGDISAECGADVAWENDKGIARGGMLMSSYFKRGPLFRIVTDGDRSTTTVSVPRDWRS